MRNLLTKINNVKASVWFLAAVLIGDALLIALIFIIENSK